MFSLCKPGNGVFMACARNGVIRLVLGLGMIINFSNSVHFNELKVSCNESDELLCMTGFTSINTVCGFWKNGI